MATKLKAGDVVISKEDGEDIHIGGRYVIKDIDEDGYIMFSDDVGDLRHRKPENYELVLSAEQPKVVSDGSSTDYYQLPANSTDLLDLIDHKRMTFGLGNIFKACYRLGEKSGTDAAYDLRKIIFFATRELARVEKASV